MNKSIIALAILGAAAGSAAAQSNVTVYGKVDLGLVLDNGPAGHSVRVSSGVSSGSRLGFKGVEDLGGGYKAGFQLETGLCTDSAAPVSTTVAVKNASGATIGTTTTTSPNFCTGGSFMGRQARGDLIGPYGTLSAGRQFSLGFLAYANLDPFGAGYAGQADNNDGKGNALVDPAGIRINNAVTYTTPTVAGFSASAEVAFGETTGNWRAGRENGGAITYSKGPVYATVTFYNLDNANGVGTARRDFMGGATYDFGIAKVHALVQRVTGHPTGAASLDVVSVMGGATVPLANGLLLASYVNRDDRGALDRDAHQASVGYLYPLSKRTTVYTAFAHVVNRHGGTIFVGNATDLGTGDQAFNLGVVHNF